MICRSKFESYDGTEMAGDYMKSEADSPRHTQTEKVFCGSDSKTFSSG